MDAVLTAMLDAVIANKGKRLSPAWRDAVEGVLDAYIGQIPESFEYKRKTYTPKTFAESLGIKTSDYVELTSFTHHPSGSTFALEIPDNWAHNQYRNVSLNELMGTLDHALANVTWITPVAHRKTAHTTRPLRFNFMRIRLFSDSTVVRSISQDQKNGFGLTHSSFLGLGPWLIVIVPLPPD